MITITIKTDNAAFADGNRDAEVGRILRNLAARFEAGIVPEKVMDVNGNTVGKVKVTR